MKKILIIGSPVAQSLSPLIHTACYKALGIENEFYYDRKEIKLNELAAAISTLKRDIYALNITMPLKTEIFKYLAWADDAAQEIGAVNSVVNDGGDLKGFNADYYGVLGALEGAGVKDLASKSVAIVGAGGAARAGLYAVREARSVTLINRSVEKARPLADKFNAKLFSLEEIEQVKNADIVINATPVGMGEDKNMSIQAEFLRPGQIAMDMIYRPLDTPFITAARAKGLQVITGEKMFIAQAARQFEIFTGRKAPYEVMERALKQELRLI